MRHYISSIIATLFLAVSCQGFLDMQPTNAGNAETAIQTPRDARTAINGVLRKMSSSSYYGRNFIIYGDAKGGDLTIYSQGRGLDYYYSFNHSATSGSGSGFWINGYSCIMNLNSLIENIIELKKESGATSFDQYLGEAYTLRAMIYFDLVRLYGMPYNYDKNSLGVPKVDKPIDATAQPTRASVADIYSLITDDLSKGEALLPVKKAENGYPGYYANKALQAKVFLYMENYTEALKAAREVIGSEVYKLYEPEDWVASWSSKGGSESIFEIGIDSESDLGTSSLGFYYLAYHRLSDAQGWFLASNYFLNLLGEDKTDVRWGVMDADEYAQNNEGVTHNGACTKYLGGPSLKGDGKNTATAVNIKVMRLSEVYLIAAEAALGTDKKEAADYLNAIRRRAPALAPRTATDITLDDIINERRKEFFGEGDRFFDLIRCNRTIEYNDDLTDVPITQRGKTVDRTYGKIVLPIDQDELNANPAIRDQQNPAYK